MAPQPKCHNPQRQPLTVALRKICRDYPAGPGILKELLQNADDAGATEIVGCALDRRIIPTSADFIPSYRNSSLTPILTLLYLYLQMALPSTKVQLCSLSTMPPSQMTTSSPSASWQTRKNFSRKMPQESLASGLAQSTTGPTRQLSCPKRACYSSIHTHPGRKNLIRPAALNTTSQPAETMKR